MKFYKNLYVGETINNPNKIKWKLRRNAGQLHIYILALAKGRDQLEIYHCAFLQQRYYRKHPPYIVGICGGYEEAVALVVKLTQEAINKNGSPDIKEFLFPDQVIKR